MIRSWEFALIPAYGFGPLVQHWLVFECIALGRAFLLDEDDPDQWNEMKRRDGLE